jgi:hypothetical protein
MLSCDVSLLTGRRSIPVAAIELSEETERRLGALFTGAARRTARDILMTRCGSSLPFCEDADAHGMERIRYAVLKLSNGSLDELERAVAIAAEDWRDVLVAAGFADSILVHEKWFPGEP